MTQLLTIGDDYVDTFPVWELDGLSKKSGETAFTTTLWKDGTVQAIPVTITEIGTSGEYRLEFTPNTLGFWSVEVDIGYNDERWGGAANVVDPSIEFLASAADDGTTVVFAVWLERDGQRVDDLSEVSAQIKDSEDTLIVNLGTDTTTTPDGIFRFTTASMNLIPHRAYVLTIQATGGGLNYYGNVGFALA